MRVFVPKLVSSPTLACGIQSNFPFFDSDEEEISFEPEIVALCIEHAKYQMRQRKGSDESFVRKEKCVIAPNMHRDELPSMRLRDQMWADSIWLPRRKMFEIANRTHNIITISVVPTNPQLLQCWYQRRIIKRSNEPVSQNPYECQSTQEKELPGLIPPRMLGFLKPFESFSSADYGVDSKIPFEENWIDHPNDIKDALEGISDPLLKHNLDYILTFFYLDLQAKSVGLVYHIGEQGFAKVFHKTIYI